MSSNVKSAVAIAAGLSIFSLSSYVLYLMFKEDKLLKRKHKKVMKIPKEQVRIVIGRNGSNIQEIENRSKTKITFQDREKDGYRYCTIKGEPNSCAVAETLINDLITNELTIETRELLVPGHTTGKIIGRCGERIHNITMVSGAKIEISSETTNGDEKKIYLKGTAEQINIAYEYIMDIVSEDLEARQKMDDLLAKREPRSKPKINGSKKSDMSLRKSWEKLTNNGTGHDRHMEVYVSAAVNPSQFWLQIVGPNANELDQLVEEMTDYYSRTENQELHKLSNPAVGEIVAAVFNFDEKWYRAEIVTLRKDDDNEQIAQLFYVDYGDTDDVPISKIFELRTDFLRLRFQAIECYLARIKPKDGVWTVDAADCFDELTHLAQWKKLRARVNGYRDRDSSPYGRAKREGSPIPGVDLYDVSNEDDIDVGLELVRNGHAVFEETLNCAASDGEENNISMKNCDSVGKNLTNGENSTDPTCSQDK